MALTGTPLKCDKRGADLCLYYNLGDDDAQLWAEHLSIIGDLTMNETEDEDELSGRSRTRQVKEYTEGDVSLSITGTQGADPNYEGCAFLISMRRGGQARDVMCLTGPIDEVGSVGWRGKMRNKDRTWNGPQTGAMTQNFNLLPAACTDTPVRPVQIATEDTVTDWSPEEFEAAPTTTSGAPAFAESILVPKKAKIKTSHSIRQLQIDKLKFYLARAKAIQVHVPFDLVAAICGEGLGNEAALFKASFNQNRMYKQRKNSLMRAEKLNVANNLAGYWTNELKEILNVPQSDESGECEGC